ncbi:hypothetical protein BJ165DRAFT_1550572 [Panaeolus papilionaceus]|nr:hypothetical protein BJ165DRAFT_1550572 [Panaeolus papilionaceus]
MTSAHFLAAQMSHAALKVDSTFSVVMEPFHQSQTTNAASATPSLKQIVLSTSESIHHVNIAFYKLHKTLLIIASSRMGNAPKAKPAIVQLKSGKTLISQKAESLRRPLQSTYRHAGDFTLALQTTSRERDEFMQGCLESAKILRRDFLLFSDDFGTTLVQVEQGRSTLVVSEEEGGQSESSGETDTSTNGAVKELFDSLHAVHSHLQEIVAFWDYHISQLSHGISSSTRPSHVDDSSNHNTDIVTTWLGYQRALVDATSSIAESVDAMSVEPRIPLERSQNDKNQNVSVLQWFWRWMTSWVGTMTWLNLSSFPTEFSAAHTYSLKPPDFVHGDTALTGTVLLYVLGRERSSLMPSHAAHMRLSGWRHLNNLVKILY